MLKRLSRSTMILLTSQRRYASQGRVVAGLWILLAILGPRLVSAVRLNLASIGIAHGYTVYASAPPGAPSVTHLADLADVLPLISPAGEQAHTNSVAWRQMGRALVLGGRPTDAEATFHRAIAANPNDIVARDALAQVHVAMGQYDQALDEWQKVRAPARLVTLGDHLLEQGHWEEAIEAYRAAIEVMPGYVEAYYPLSRVLLRYSRDVAGALSLLHTARDLAPTSPWPYVSIGDLYANRGRIEEAIPWYAQALEVAPREPHLDTKLAWAYATLGDQMLDARQWTRAETAYHAALEVVPDYVGAYHGLARLVLEGRNDRPAAIATLQRAIVMDPANFHTYLLMGDFVVNEDPSGADRWYRQAESILRATPRPTAETHAQRGIVYARRRQYEAAIEELQTAIRLDPRNASYHITLGDLYRGLQDIERARGEYCRALELDPPNAHAQRQLASLSVASPTPPGEGFHLTLYCP